MRGAGDYLNSLTDFAALLGSIEEADKAARAGAHAPDVIHGMGFEIIQ